jgi:P4 family phage/plasmid primase-like protien
MPSPTITIARGSGKKCDHWTNETLALDALAEELTTHKAGPKDGPGILLGALESDGAKTADNVAFRSGIAIDIDGGPDPQEVKRRIEALPWFCAWHTTWSHDLPGKGNRLRPVFPLDKPLHREDFEDQMAFEDYFRAFNDAVAEKLGVVQDPTVSRINQMVYLPRVPVGSNVPPLAGVWRGEKLLDPGDLEFTVEPRGQSNVAPGPGVFEDIVRVYTMLRHIDPADLPYLDWFRVVAALHHGAGGGREGYELATVFSAQDVARFRKDDIDCRWKGISSGRVGGEVSLATLAHKAMQSGWDGKTLSTSPTAQWLRREQIVGALQAGSGIRDAIDLTAVVFDDEDATPAQVAKSLEERIREVEDPTGEGYEALTANLLQEVRTAGLSAPQVDKLIRLIRKRTGATLGVLRQAMAEAAQADQAAQRDQEPDGLEIALRGVNAEFGEGNLILVNGQFWAWDGTGVWRQVGERLVKQAIQQHTVARSERKKHVIDNAIDMLKNELHVEQDPFICDCDELVINCLNGELHWCDIPFGEWELKPHVRENYRIAQVPVDYDPDAKCPRFDQFLAEISLGDPDVEQKVQLIYEMIGYCLLAVCYLEKFFMLVGPGANGKSVLLNTLADLIGRESVAGVQPGELDNRNHRAHLQGKLVNIVTEVKKGHLLDDGALKAIVSGELVTADRKYEHPFTFRPTATMVFATNHLPDVKDFSHGMFRRAVVIPFTRTFAEHEQDKQLQSKLAKELPGILTKAVDAVGYVLQRGHFITPPSVEAAVDKWRREGDQVARFVEDKCKAEPEAQTPTSDLYSSYKAWAYNEDGIKHRLGHPEFSKRIDGLGFKLGRSSSSRFARGLSLKDPKPPSLFP